MTYNLLRFAHILGAILMGAGLVAVWMADLRSRQVRDLTAFAEAVRNIAVCYDGLVVPGALLLLASGSWLIGQYYGGLASLGVPWLAGMVVLFLAEFIEGNTVTRLYFMRLRRMTRDALAQGRFTPELERERGKSLPSFTHFLDLPVLTLIVALGALKPDSWTLFIAGSILALAVASALNTWIPRLYPWGNERQSGSARPA
ncbi:MAG TPA: DUF2269 domain-containing protein [Rubrivivax sp.]|nr:DUF2269 domain-containing protein [Rubrivivax sp.]